MAGSMSRGAAAVSFPPRRPTPNAPSARDPRRCADARNSRRQTTGGSGFLRDKARTRGPAQGGGDEGPPRCRPRGSGALPSDADEPTEDVVVALDDNNDDNNADDDVEDVLNDHDEEDDK